MLPRTRSSTVAAGDDDGEDSVGKAFWNLFIALINATLILAIICLWLALRVLSAADEVSEQVAVASQNIEASREQIAAMTDAIADLESEVSDLRTAQDPNFEEVKARLDAIEERLLPLGNTLAWVSVTPDELMDRAVRAAFLQAGAIVARSLQARSAADADPSSE